MSHPNKPSDSEPHVTVDFEVSRPAHDDRTCSQEVEPVHPKPRQLGPYILRREIGRGAMGTVYEAEHTKLRRRVALKILPREFTAVPGRLSRFRREMEAIGRLDHANIVRAFDAGEAEETHFLVMEFVQGQDVDKLIQCAGQLPIGAACEIARQVALGLEHIYENHLVHRDIKPSNLLLDENGTVKILDLGIARLRREDATDSYQTSIGSMIGTPDYVAPEQIESSAEVDIRADIYSLGCTLYTLIAGHPPFHGSEYETQMSKLLAHSKQAAPPLRKICPSVPATLSDFVEKMMAKDPDDRPTTPSEVAAAMAEWADPNELTKYCQTDATGREKLRMGGTEKTEAIHAHVPGMSFGKGHAIACGIVGLIVLLVTGPFVYQVDGPLNGAAANRTDDNGEDNGDDNGAETLPTSLQTTKEPSLKSPNPDDREPSVPLTDIAASTSAIATDTNRVATSVEHIDHNTERIAETLDGLRDAFRMAARSGDIVPEPASVGEYYHNACAYQRQGNYEAARQMYFLLFEQDADFVDIHRSFQQLLRSRHNLDEIRQIYSSLPGNASGLVRRYARALLADGKDKTTQLEQIAKKDRFAPAAFELARLHSPDVVGKQTLLDKQLEKMWLTRFRELDAAGEHSAYFLDPSEADAMRHAAESRWADVQEIADATFHSPVAVDLMSSKGFVSLTVTVAEPVREIEYRLRADEPFRSTGHLAAIDPATGARAVQPVIMLPPQANPQQIEIRYRDLHNELRGPYTIKLGNAAVEADKRRKLSISAPYWVKFVDHRGESYIDFQLLAHTAGELIKEVQYGLNEDVPNQAIVLSDPTHDGDKNRVAVDDGIESAVVRILFNDGTSSQVQRFYRER